MRPQPDPDDMVELTAGVLSSAVLLTPQQRIPPNLKFEVDDVEKDWAYPCKFDYIVSRYMAASINDWPTYVKRAYEYVRC